MGAPQNTATLEVWMQITDKGRKKLATLLVVQDRSARSLAREVGWKSHTILLRILNGEQKTIDGDRAIAMAAILGVGMDDLFVPRVSTTGRRSVQHNTRKAA